MKGQLSLFDELNIARDPKPNIEKAKKRKWEDAFQRMSDKMAQDETTPRGKCGYMNFCDCCSDNSYGRPCVRAFNAYCRDNHIQVNYDDLNSVEEWI